MKTLKEMSGDFPNLIFISNNNPKSISLALKLVNKNGKIIIFSGIKKSNANGTFGPINIDPNFIHYNKFPFMVALTQIQKTYRRQ